GWEARPRSSRRTCALLVESLADGSEATAERLLVNPQVGGVHQHAEPSIGPCTQLIDVHHGQHGGLAVSVAGPHDAPGGRTEDRAGEVAGNPEGSGEGGLADPERIDALDGRDLVDVLEALGGLDLGDDQDIIIRVLYLPAHVAALEVVVGHGEGTAATAPGRVLRTGDDVPRLRRGADERD